MPYADASAAAANKRAHYLSNRAVYIARALAGKAKARDAARAEVAAYLATHPCVDCGEADPIVLEFDHRGDKLFSISDAVRKGSMSLGRLRAEAAKCDVRCANCHRRRTALSLGWYKVLAR